MIALSISSTAHHTYIIHILVYLFMLFYCKKSLGTVSIIGFVSESMERGDIHNPRPSSLVDSIGGMDFSPK